jgi:hypothetical protein
VADPVLAVEDSQLLRAIDAAEADAFSVAIVQDFDGVAVEDGDDGAGEVGGRESRRGCQEREE